VETPELRFGKMHENAKTNTMKTKILTTQDGIELRYAYAACEPDKPWIALIIPFGLDVEITAPFFEFFQSHYNVFAWESRSILEASDRECSVSELSIDRHVADLLDIMDDLHIDEAILVGYCSGAGIALAAINQQPNRFSQLILAHGEYTMLGNRHLVTQFAGDMDVLLSLAASSAERAQLVFDKINNERFDANLPRPAGLDRPFSDVRFLKRYANNYLAYKSVDFERLAAEVAHPTLVMAGRKDVQVNVESAQKIASLIRGASIFIDPDADHYGILTQDSPTLIAVWNNICEGMHAQGRGR
jgi:pimeloyl-ACP methyl ester carboxylesterase